MAKMKASSCVVIGTTTINMKGQELPPPACYMKTLLSPEVEGLYRSVSLILKNCVCVLENSHQHLAVESYVLSRMLYKMNNQWRGEKSLQGLKRVNVCLTRFKECKILDYVTDLNNHFQECNLYVGEIYLPSLQMVVYLLKQLLLLAHRMSKAFKYCQYAYIYISQNLALGNFIPQNMIYLSLLSRTWTLCKSLCLHTCEWYEGIYKHIDLFPKAEIVVDIENLPENIHSLIAAEHMTANKDSSENSMEKTSENMFIQSNTELCSDLLTSADIGDIDGGCTDYRQGKTWKALNGELKSDSLSNEDSTEELGVQVSRNQCNSVDNQEDFGSPLSENVGSHERVDLLEMQTKIDRCKSFKKLKCLVLTIEETFGKSKQTVACRKRLQVLKKDHKQSGKRADALITGKNEVAKLLGDKGDPGLRHTMTCMKESQGSIEKKAVNKQQSSKAETNVLLEETGDDMSDINDYRRDQNIQPVNEDNESDSFDSWSEDLGIQVSRKSGSCDVNIENSKADVEIHDSQNMECEGLDTHEIQAKIHQCKSFKKLKCLVLKIEEAFGKTKQTVACRQRLQVLKKENKQNGDAIRMGMQEVDKLLGSNSNAELCRNSIKENQKSIEKTKVKKQQATASKFDIEEILKKPYKMLEKLRNPVDDYDMQKVKKCALQLKKIKKMYSQECDMNQKRVLLKKAETKVSKLLLS